jgi:hypothetical protein
MMEYRVQIDDGNGQPIRNVVLKATTRPPVAGEWVDVDGHWYEVQLGMHLPPPGDAPDARELVLCVVPVEPARDGLRSPSADGTDQTQSQAESRLTELEGGADLVDAVAQALRDLATDLGEHSDKLAAAIRASEGKLDPRLQEEAHQFSRRAKQQYAYLLVNAPKRKG